MGKLMIDIAHVHKQSDVKESIALAKFMWHNSVNPLTYYETQICCPHFTQITTTNFENMTKHRNTLQ